MLTSVPDVTQSEWASLEDGGGTRTLRLVLMHEDECRAADIVANRL